MDPIDFLVKHAPFDTLSPAGRSQVASGIEISFVAGGALILQRDGVPATHLYVLRKGEVALERDGVSLEHVGPGECFAFPSLLGQVPPNCDARATQDCLLYQLPAELFRTLVHEHPEFAEFFMAELSARLRKASVRSPAPLRDPLTRPLQTLTLDHPLFVAPTQSIAEVATLMRDHDQSAALIGEPNDPPNRWGIVTDRDFRNRVVATAHDVRQPIAEVASHGLAVLSASDSLFDALALMIERDIHHVPVLNDDEQGPILRGIVTDDGLMREHLQSPGHLLQRILRAEQGRAPDDFPTALATMVTNLHSSGLQALKIGTLVASLNDALISKLCRDAQVQLGQPPVPYAWISFGSEGRREQALLTDQDNALIYADPPAGQRHACERYFAAFGECVIQAAIVAGIPACKGGYMANRWFGSIDHFVQLFRQWGEKPEPAHMMHAANFFDFRVITGTLAVPALEEAVQWCAAQPRFLAHMARQVLALRPHIGLFGRIGNREDHLDLKANAIGPLVGLARLFALEGGERQGSTVDRLIQAVATHVISDATSATLIEAFRFAFELRMEHQITELRAQRLPSNVVDLTQLSSLDRRHLKETMLAIRDVQDRVETRFHVLALG